MEQIDVGVKLSSVALVLLPQRVETPSAVEGAAPTVEVRDMPTLTLHYTVEYTRQATGTSRITRIEQLSLNELPSGAEAVLRHLNSIAIQHITQYEIATVTGVFEDE